MLRRTLQDIELLKLLQTKQGWTRRQLKDFVAAFFKAREGGVESVKNWFSLRRAVQQLLAGPEPSKPAAP